MITKVLPKVQPTFVSQAQLQIPGFTLFTNFPIDCDLCNVVTGRGVTVYISRKLKTAHQVHFSNLSFQEQLWIKVPLKGRDSLLNRLYLPKSIC